MTSITKELIKERGKPRYEEVEIDGWGTIGFRSTNQVKLSRRQTWMAKEHENGNDQPMHAMRVWELIDQAMENEDKPLFTDDDAEWLVQLDPYRINPLFDALVQFNGGTVGNLRSESNGSSES